MHISLRNPILIIINWTKFNISMSLMFLRLKNGDQLYNTSLVYYVIGIHFPLILCIKVLAMFRKRQVLTVKTKYTQYLTICSISESCFVQCSGNEALEQSLFVPHLCRQIECFLLSCPIKFSYYVT